jgi:hypothetical protein
MTIGSITQIVVSGALHWFHTMSPHAILVLHLHGVSDTPASRSANELSIVGVDGDGATSTLARVSVPLKGVVLLTSSQPAKGLTHSAHGVDGRRNKKAKVLINMLKIHGIIMCFNRSIGNGDF